MTNPEILTDKVFRTKTGYCHITPDKIILTRDGIAGNVAKVTVGNTIWRITIIYGAFAVFLSFRIYDGYKNGQSFALLFPASIIVFLLYGILSSLNNSAAPVIDRDTITKVKFKNGTSGLTRSRFEVFFTDEKGRIKKRLIMLPGSLTGGNDETRIALGIMEEEKLID